MYTIVYVTDLLMHLLSSSTTRDSQEIDTHCTLLRKRTTHLWDKQTTNLSNVFYESRKTNESGCISSRGNDVRVYLVCAYGKTNKLFACLDC